MFLKKIFAIFNQFIVQNQFIFISQLLVGCDWSIFQVALDCSSGRFSCCQNFSRVSPSVPKSLFTRKEGYSNKGVTLALTHFFFLSSFGLQGSQLYPGRRATLSAYQGDPGRRVNLPCLLVSRPYECNRALVAPCTLRFPYL